MSLRAREGEKTTRSLPILIVMLLTTSGSVSAQPVPTGTWSVEGVGWSVFLKVEGEKLTGLVSHCATVFPSLTEIFDSRIAGDAITFKCTSPDRDLYDHVCRIVERACDDAHLGEARSRGRDRQRRRRQDLWSVGDEALYCSAYSDGELAKAANVTRGLEFAAAINLREKNAKVEGLLFVPQAVPRVPSGDRHHQVRPGLLAL